MLQWFPQLISIGARDMCRQTLLLDLIPPPQAVRERLGDVLREAKLLRQLLRLADTAQDFRIADEVIAKEAACKNCVDDDARWCDIDVEQE